MNMTELTERELETLIEAMEAWEKQPLSDGFQGSLLGSIFGSMAGQDRTERDAEMKRGIAEAEGKTKIRRSIATILKAKLEIARQGVQGKAIEAAVVPQ